MGLDEDTKGLKKPAQEEAEERSERSPQTGLETLAVVAKIAHLLRTEPNLASEDGEADGATSGKNAEKSLVARDEFASSQETAGLGGEAEQNHGQDTDMELMPMELKRIHVFLRVSHFRRTNAALGMPSLGSTALELKRQQETVDSRNRTRVSPSDTK